MSQASKRKKRNDGHSVLSRRLTRFVAIGIGLAAAIIGEGLQSKGLSQSYVETGLTTLLLLWALLAAFRPEWRRSRYWLAMLGIAVLHISFWLYIERRTGQLGFIPMFTLVAVELVVGAALIMKLIPEDQRHARIHSPLVTRPYLRQPNFGKSPTPASPT